jgi:hypothetical protein
MLVLRSPQLTEIRRVRIAPFVPELAAELRARFPDELTARPDEELLPLVREAALRGLAHGLESLRDLSRFLNLQVVLGWSFDTEQPWAAAYLDDPEVPSPSTRLDRLVKASVARLELEERNARLRRRFGA